MYNFNPQTADWQSEGLFYRIKQIRPVAPSFTILPKVPLKRSLTVSGIRITLDVSPS